jgi:hypothetical protein
MRADRRWPSPQPGAKSGSNTGHPSLAAFVLGLLCAIFFSFDVARRTFGQTRCLKSRDSVEGLLRVIEETVENRALLAILKTSLEVHCARQHIVLWETDSPFTTGIAGSGTASPLEEQYRRVRFNLKLAGEVDYQVFRVFRFSQFRNCYARQRSRHVPTFCF